MEPSLPIIVLLAVVQGVTEFLPVSSSGHLVVVSAILAGGDASALEIADLNVVLHVGTLGSIVVFYWRRIIELASRDKRVLPLLLMGTLPAVALGIPLRYCCRGLLESPLVTGCMLMVTGAVLLAFARLKRSDEPYTSLGWRRTLVIGLSQAVAILPGLSRSGATISTGSALGISPKDAATFSFLLAIPVIAGAGLLECVHVVSDSTIQTPLHHLAIGAGVSFCVGLFSLWWLVRWVEQGKLQWFAYWCIPLGASVVVWEFFGR